MLAVVRWTPWSPLLFQQASREIETIEEVAMDGAGQPSSPASWQSGQPDAAFSTINYWPLTDSPPPHRIGKCPAAEARARGIASLRMQLASQCE